MNYKEISKINDSAEDHYVVVINIERTGYSPSQIDSTITVGELISFLEDFDEDTPVYTASDNKYTFGGISLSDIEEVAVEDFD